MQGCNDIKVIDVMPPRSGSSDDNLEKNPTTPTQPHLARASTLGGYVAHHVHVNTIVTRSTYFVLKLYQHRIEVMHRKAQTSADVRLGFAQVTLPMSTPASSIVQC